MNVSEHTAQHTEQRTAAALGYFDGMHKGHTAVIEHTCTAARQRGLEPAAFMMRGEPQLPKFGGRSDMCLMTYPAKTELLKERFGITRLYTPDFEDIRSLPPEEFFERGIIGELNAGYVCCGEDFHFGKGGAGTPGLLKELCAAKGMECEVIPPVCIGGSPVSSTRIRELIRAGNMEDANKLMTVPLSYELPVLTGKQLGRTIGFPTINQVIPANMVHPKYGVYVSRVRLGDVTYPAVTDIGVKPTVKSDSEEIMETHIIGFSGDLYGKNVRVSLLAYIRGEMKFSGLDELRTQLEKDKNSVINA